MDIYHLELRNSPSSETQAPLVVLASTPGGIGNWWPKHPKLQLVRGWGTVVNSWYTQSYPPKTYLDDTDI